MFPQLPRFGLPKVSYSNDKAIMDVAFQCSYFNRLQLHQINLVHLCLQIYFLSDLICPLSSRVINYYMLGMKDAWLDSEHTWPRVKISRGARTILDEIHENSTLRRSSSFVAYQFY